MSQVLAAPTKTHFPARPGSDAWRPALLLVSYCLFLFFYGIQRGELYRTENLRAIIAAEFLRSGNWVVPTLYGQPLFTKPPGMYAAIALVSWPFGGVNEVTARLPAALAAAALVFLAFWYFRRQFGTRAGFVAALLTPLSTMWLDKAGTAEIDMLQVFWVGASLLFFLRALEAEEDDVRPARAFPWWVLSLLGVAGGALTKWTAPAFFYLTVVPVLAWRGRLRLLFTWRHLAAATLGGGLCLAWVAAAVQLQGWDVLYQTVRREALPRLSPTHHHRPYPWAESGTFPLVFLAAHLPASAFALVTLWPGFMRLWDERGRRTLQVLHCWLWPNLLFWTVVPHHSPRHSFPIVGAITGLAAMAWIAWLDGRLPWPLFARSFFLRLKPLARPQPALLTLVVVWLVAKLVFVHVVTPGRNGTRHPRAKGQLLATLVPPDQTLYLSALKDEGIMFYYGRTVRRVNNLAEVPSTGEPVYAILQEVERQRWDPGAHPLEILHELLDEQGDPIVLVKIHGRPVGGSP